jgi:hypothetical protein
MKKPPKGVWMCRYDIDLLQDIEPGHGRVYGMGTRKTDACARYCARRLNETCPGPVKYERVDK